MSHRHKHVLGVKNGLIAMLIAIFALNTAVAMGDETDLATAAEEYVYLGLELGQYDLPRAERVARAGR